MLDLALVDYNLHSYFVVHKRMDLFRNALVTSNIFLDQCMQVAQTFNDPLDSGRILGAKLHS